MAQGALTFTGLFRRRTLSPVRVISAEVTWGRASNRQTKLWVLLGAIGRTSVGLNRDAWDERQLEDLREDLGLPLETVPGLERPAELRKSYPGSIPWWSAHPSLTTVVAIAAVAALVLAAEGLAS